MRKEIRVDIVLKLRITSAFKKEDIEKAVEDSLRHICDIYTEEGGVVNIEIHDETN